VSFDFNKLASLILLQDAIVEQLGAEVPLKKVPTLFLVIVISSK